MNKYTVLGRVAEGAHGIVLKARHIQTGETVAMKRVPLKKLENGIPNSALREIKTLRMIDCENVVKLLDVFPHGSGFVLVFEYVFTDLAEVLRTIPERLKSCHVKSYLKMLLQGIAYCHNIRIIHRDLKPANLLISTSGQLKIADFGLARVMVKEGDRLYSHQVATRWYRAPELLYGSRQYDEGVDLWSVGCIFGEMLNHSPLFPGENDIDQLCIVMRTLGTPSEESWPGLTELPDYNKITFPEMKSIPVEEIVPDATSDAVDLLKQFIIYPSKQRIAASKALIHPYFFTLPLPCAFKDFVTPTEKRGSSQLRMDPDLNQYVFKMDSLPDLELVQSFSSFLACD